MEIIFIVILNIYLIEILLIKNTIMKVIIKSLRIIDVNSKHHNKVKDLLIEDGIIKKIDKKISKKGF